MNKAISDGTDTHGQISKISVILSEMFLDLSRLKRALNGIDFVIHAAAMNHRCIAEYNPDEYANKTIGGAENVIQAALSSQVSRVVALSTDKACAPIFYTERLN